MAKSKNLKTRTIVGEIESIGEAAKKAGSSKEKQFLSSFLHQLMVAKEKREGKKIKIEKLPPVQIEAKKLRKKLKTFTIEEEKTEIPKKKKIEKSKIEKKKVKIEESEEEPFEAPIYKRALPELPEPPKLTKEWPMPVPKAPGRPSEQEAMVAPTAELPFPEPKIPLPNSTLVSRESTISPNIDLNKLNPLIADKTISVIQCDGANLPIKITKQKIIQRTRITLNEDEIKAVIKKFADRANQIMTEPIFKTQIGNLSITAIISTFAGSKFVISKIYF